MAMSKEENLARLRHKKRAMKASLTRFENFLKDINNVDIDEVKIRWERAEEASRTLNEILLEISFLDDALTEVESNKELEESESKFLHLKLLVERAIKGRIGLTEGDENCELTTQNVVINDNNLHRESRGYNNFIRLPKIELPTFSGQYEDWYTFYDVFNSLIHSNNALNDVQRFHYLKSALKGEAAESIAALEISGINYTNAWSRLKERYDNPKLIIQTHISAIFELPVVKKENGIAIRQVLDGVLKHTRVLQALKRPTQHWDDLLIYIIASKLDTVTLKEWENTLEIMGVPSFNELVVFLNKRCQTLEAIANQQHFQVGTLARKAGPNKAVTAHVAAAKFKCAYCKGEHQIYQCKAFQSLSVAERKNQIKLKGLCLNCLRLNHMAKDCVASNCKICGKRHNSLLHNDEDKNKDNRVTQLSRSQDQESKENNPNTDNAACHYVKSEESKAQRQVLLSTAMVKVKNNREQWVQGRALLDSGSQSNFVSENFLRRLGLKCSGTNIEVSGINQQVSRALKIVNLNIKSRFESYETELKCVVLPSITRSLPAIEISKSELEVPSNIRLADPEFNIPREVDLLIGAERFWDLVCVGQIKLGRNKPTLQKSTLGWIIAGIIGHGKGTGQTRSNLSTEQQLSDTVNRFWQIEDCLTQAKLNDEDRNVEECFANSYSRNIDGRFIVKLPVNLRVLSQIGSSEEIAKKRLLLIEKRFAKDPEFKAEYTNFMQEYQSLGHMRLVADAADNKKRIFLPHQAVVREDAATTKIRVVFDASSKDSKGLSLNDALYKGPALQSDLFTLILRFRCHRYVICADIKKMYRQIIVHEDHTPLQTILWRDKPSEPIQRFELLTVTYGTKPASFLAVKCLHRLAELERERFPIAATAVLTDFYMDDLISGSETLQGIEELKNQMIKLLASGGFELHKWKSNITSQSSETTKAYDSQVDFFKEEESKLLGILWDSNRDILCYRSPNLKLEGKVTKRVILSEVSRLFDPLGLVGPIVTAAKILIQSLWVCKIGWDDPVPMSVYKAWHQIKSQL